ncbi:MAG: DUF1772 domain-containing protein [Anaerolineae bacterium]|jgi:uncharacterized membrane protein|nr:DUF1772 domain-containing protein [Anaerolineae bacterium]
MFPLTTLALAGGILCTGLFSGLMFTLVFLLQLKWQQQTATAYITDIQPFLRVGKGNRAVTLILIGGILGPILALLTGQGAAGAMVPLLTGLALLLFAAGAAGITLVFNLPVYTALMALDASAPAATWAALRRRFHRLNQARLLASFSAFGLLVAALAAQNYPAI